MSTQKARMIFGADAAKTSALKNDSWTAGHPGELTTIQTTTPKKAIVLTSATRVERSADCSPARRGPRDPRKAGRPPVSSGPPTWPVDADMRQSVRGS